MDEELKNTIIDYVRSERYSELSFLMFNALFAADVENYHEHLSRYITNSNFIDFTEMQCRRNFSPDLSDELIVSNYFLVLGLVTGAIQLGFIS